MKPEQQKALREPFPREKVGLLPKPLTRDAQKGRCDVCGQRHGLPAVHLDYVGHAAVTDRLLAVDPDWSWEPVAFGADGLPLLDGNGGLWIRLTVCGVTRLGYGDADGKRGGQAVKEAIGDALRNAAMRFGVALDLWSKEDLTPGVDKPSSELSDDDGTALAKARERVMATAVRIKPDLKNAPIRDVAKFVGAALTARGKSIESAQDLEDLADEWEEQLENPVLTPEDMS